MKSTVLSRIAEARGKISPFAAKTTWGARILSVVAAMCGGLLTASPASAVGAVYEIPVTIEVHHELDLNVPLIPVVTTTLSVVGTFRGAATDGEDAVEVCQREYSGDTPNFPFLKEFPGVDDNARLTDTDPGAPHISVFLRRASLSPTDPPLGTIIIDAAECAEVADGEIGENQYAAFVSGHNFDVDDAHLVAATDDGLSVETFFAVASTEGEAAIRAANMCEAVYPLATGRICGEPVIIEPPEITDFSGGAIYEVSGTLAVTEHRYATTGPTIITTPLLLQTVTINLTGTLRGAAASQEAALAACRNAAANTTLSFPFLGMSVRTDTEAFTIVPTVALTINADTCTVRPQEEEGVAAFFTGHSYTVISDNLPLVERSFETFVAIAASRNEARAMALALCVADYPDNEGANCAEGAGFDFSGTPAVSIAPPSGPSGSDSAEKAALYFGGAAAVAIAAFYLSGGDLSWFSAAPDFGYSITESGYAYNYGGRVDFRKDRWHLYWTGGGANTNGDFGDFGFASGGEYKTDLWSAAFSEKVRGETADYDLSLSAKYESGIWELSPAYRLHSRFEREQNGWESETENSLNLEGVLRANRWTVRSAAGFQWREAEDFGDNAKLKISAVRNL